MMERTIKKQSITTMGIDLAKTVFHLCGMNRRGKIVLQKQLRRMALKPYLAQLPPCRIGMEACSSTCHWARYYLAQEHEMSKPTSQPSDSPPAETPPVPAPRSLPRPVHIPNAPPPNTRQRIAPLRYRPAP